MVYNANNQCFNLYLCFTLVRCGLHQLNVKNVFFCKSHKDPMSIFDVIKTKPLCLSLCSFVFNKNSFIRICTPYVKKRFAINHTVNNFEYFKVDWKQILLILCLKSVVRYQRKKYFIYLYLITN